MTQFHRRSVGNYQIVVKEDTHGYPVLEYGYGENPKQLRHFHKNEIGTAVDEANFIADIIKEYRSNLVNQIGKLLQEEYITKL